MFASLSFRSRSALVALLTTLGLWCSPVAHAAGPFPIECQYLEETPSFASLLALWDVLFDTPPRKPDVPDPTSCERPGHQVLVGPGDVFVVVQEAHYKEAVKAADGKPMRLFLNGFDLGGQGTLVGVEKQNAKVALRFHAGSRKEGAEKFWSTLYEKNGLLSEAPLRAAVGWDTEPAFVMSGKKPVNAPSVYVAVTGWWPLTLGIGLLFFVLASFVFALWKTDIFRIAPILPLWRDARALRTHLGPIDESKISEKVEAILEAVRSKTSYKEFAWPTTVGMTPDAYCKACIAIAESALTSRQLAENEMVNAMVGLSIRSAEWRPIRLPYSLARVQSGAWLIFAIAAAILLWLVYGDFPALEGSVLGLVAISAATTGGSLLVDSQKPKATSLSVDFFHDILTDPDDVQQAHRYQAVIVNILLLVVGVTYVIQHLVYPTFDATWLGLLGVSGIAQTLGKQVVERDKDTPPPVPPGGSPTAPVDSEAEGAAAKPGATEAAAAPVAPDATAVRN